MTCIVGIQHGGKVYIGGDSAGVDGNLGRYVRADKKVFRNGQFIMGFTSSFRMGQLLAYKLSPPNIKEGQDPLEFMVVDFVEAVRSCLKEGGVARIEHNIEEGGSFLVGHRGQLFEIHDDFQVGIPTRGYSACGCGEDFALGSLYETVKKPPMERVRRALKAAEAMSGGVCAPFHVLSD
jgi:ATP-dependent protease HslVU (ClpYQ) peptidase subunit